MATGPDQRLSTNPEQQSSPKNSGQLTGWEEVAALAKTPEEFATSLRHDEVPDTPTATDPDHDKVSSSLTIIDDNDLYDDYELSPEEELSFERYAQYKHLEPDFKAAVRALFEDADRHTSKDEYYDNFLVESDLLTPLVECTKDEEVAFTARFDFESAVKSYAIENGYDFDDINSDEDESSLTDQALALSIISAAKKYSHGKLTDDQFQLSCQAVNNLGLSIPLNPTNRNVREIFAGITQEEYSINRQLSEVGIIDEDFTKALHRDSIDRLFQSVGEETPAHLKDPSPEMSKYWNDLSDDLGIDAFAIYVNAAQSSINMAKFKRLTEPISPAIYFTESGQPTPIAFGPESPLLDRAFRDPKEYRSYANETYALIQKFPELLDPSDQLLVNALGKAISSDDPSLRSGLNHFYSFNRRHSKDSLTNADGQPSEKFWETIDTSADLGLIKLFPNYENHFSSSRIAAADLPSETRSDLRSFLKSSPAYYNDITVDQVLSSDGQLTDAFYNSTAIPVIGDLRAETLAADFPNESAKHFDAQTQTYLKLPPEYREFLISHFKDQLDAPNFQYADAIKDYVSDTAPTDILFETAFQDGRFDLLTGLPLRDEKDLPFTDNQRYALDHYKQILREDPEHGPDVGAEYARAVTMINLDDLSHEQIDSLVDTVNRITNSNAYELRNSGQNFLRDVIRSADPNKSLEQIEQVFLHNNLPYAGKVFRTFQVLHPADMAFDDEFAYCGVIDRGILRNLPNTGPLSRESVLFADVIKSSIMSNNRPMKQYIKNLRSGQDLTNRLLNDEVSYADLSEAEQSTLSTFTDHVATLYNQTQKGKQESFRRTDDIKHDLRALSAAFGPTKRYSLSDRIVRSFCQPLGIRGLTDLENYINMSIEIADSRNRERFVNNDFSLHENDLVKATNPRYIGQILQNGAVCKEFLNGEADSDSTPLDADITRLGAECTGNIREAIDWKNRHASFGSMAVNLVIKNSDLIQTSANHYDPSKLELIENGSSDCGIRTGFPSSVIDFIVFDQTPNDRSIPTSERNRLYSEIAKNGFYIPVVDKTTGECIFSPDDYDKLRRTLSGLERYDAPEFLFASDTDLYTPGIESLTNTVLAQDTENSRQYSAIQSHFTDLLQRNFPDFRGLKNVADGDLTPNFIELIDTGSTGRGTSIPGSKADFDFIMRIDASTYLNHQRLSVFEDTLRQALSAGEDRSNSNGLRLKDVSVPNLDDSVDIDVSFVQRTNHLEFSSDQAIKERLATIRTQDPERYPAVIANIILAKQLLKNADAYKPKHSSDTLDLDKKGGLGGIGIENWILQNGGSLKVAAESFVAAADQAGDDFTTFCDTYPIWDAGQNHFAVRDNEEYHDLHKPTYDNFVANNMSPDGFQRMTTALRNYLSLIKS